MAETNYVSNYVSHSPFAQRSGGDFASKMGGTSFRGRSKASEGEYMSSQRSMGRQSSPIK